MHANMRHVTDRMAMADIGSVLKFLDAEPARARARRAASAIASAAGCRWRRRRSFPTSFAPRASLHGTSMVTDAAEFAASLRRQDARRNLLRLCREGSRSRRRPTIETLGELYARSKPTCATAPSSIPAPMHGYALPDRDIFDKPAANRDWENIFAMFKRQLG